MSKEKMLFIIFIIVFVFLVLAIFLNDLTRPTGY